MSSRQISSPRAARTVSRKEHTDEELNDYRQCFNLYVSDKLAATLDADKLGTVLRCLGFAPSQGDLDLYCSNASDSANMSFDEVLNAIGDAKGHLITAEDAANAFGHFDKGAGHMSVKELKGVLLELGEPLSNDVVDTWLKEVDPKNTGVVRRDEFVKMASECA